MLQKRDPSNCLKKFSLELCTCNLTRHARLLYRKLYRITVITFNLCLLEFYYSFIHITTTSGLTTLLFMEHLILEGFLFKMNIEMNEYFEIYYFHLLQHNGQQGWRSVAHQCGPPVWPTSVARVPFRPRAIWGLSLLLILALLRAFSYHHIQTPTSPIPIRPG